jgi:Ca-activated chloride channel family protein
MKADGEVTRILLATDGDFNVGVSDPDGLESYVAKKRDTGDLPVGPRLRFVATLTTRHMQALAQNGNGTAAYIDTLSAKLSKVLVTKRPAPLFPIADDVKIQVEWNPATVAEYRLIGYETRASTARGFQQRQGGRRRDRRGHAGDGDLRDHRAGVGRAAERPPALWHVRDRRRHRANLASCACAGKRRAKIPRPCRNPDHREPKVPASETRFAAAIAGFGQLLQGSVYLGDWGWDAIELALANRGDDRSDP